MKHTLLLTLLSRLVRERPLAAEDACVLCGYWRCRCGQNSS